MNKIATFMRESSLARFLIPGGLIFIIFGIAFFIINYKNQNFIEVKSTVTDVKLIQEAYTDADGNYEEASYDITVKYTVNDKEYTTVLNNMTEYKKGDTITIYYDPKDPNIVTTTKSLIWPIVVIVGGLVAFIIGIISAVNAVKKHKDMKEQEKKWEEKNV